MTTTEQWPAPHPTFQPPAPIPPGMYYRTSGMAIASLVLGLLWFGWVGSLLAIIFGHCAQSEIRRSGGTIGGKGMATAGLVLGYLAFVVFGLMILAITVSAASSTGY